MFFEVFVAKELKNVGYHKKSPLLIDIYVLKW